MTYGWLSFQLFLKQNEKIQEKLKKNGQINGNRQLELELASLGTQEFLMKEMSSAMEYRKKLFAKVGRLELEVMNLEKKTQEKNEKVTQKKRMKPDPLTLMSEKELQLSSEQRLDLYRAGLPQSYPYGVCFPGLVLPMKTEPRSPRGKSPKRGREKEQDQKEKEKRLNAFEQRVKNIIMNTLNEPTMPAKRSREKCRKMSTSSATSSASGSEMSGEAFPPPSSTQAVYTPSAHLITNSFVGSDSSRGLFSACSTPPSIVSAPDGMRLENISPVLFEKGTGESSSQCKPDYTKASPAKLALKRHLDEEACSKHGPNKIPQLEPGEIIRSAAASVDASSHLMHSSEKERHEVKAPVLDSEHKDGTLQSPSCRSKSPGKGNSRPSSSESTSASQMNREHCAPEAASQLDAVTTSGDMLDECTVKNQTAVLDILPTLEDACQGGSIGSLENCSLPQMTEGLSSKYYNVLKGMPVVQIEPLKLGVNGTQLLNGLILKESEKKKEKASKRKRSQSKSPSRASSVKSPKRQSSNDSVASMVSNATQPLAIKAISSPESSDKPSPVEEAHHAPSLESNASTNTGLFWYFFYLCAKGSQIVIFTLTNCTIKPFQTK